MLNEFIRRISNKPGSENPVLQYKPEDYAKLVLRASVDRDNLGYDAIDFFGNLKKRGGIDQNEVLHGLKVFALQVFTDNGGNCRKKSDGNICKPLSISNSIPQRHYLPQGFLPQRFLDLHLHRPYKKPINIDTIDFVCLTLIDHFISHGGVVFSAKMYTYKSEPFIPDYQDYRKWQYTKDSMDATVAGGAFNEWPEGYSPRNADTKWLAIKFIAANLLDWNNPGFIPPEYIDKFAEQLIAE